MKALREQTLAELCGVQVHRHARIRVRPRNNSDEMMSSSLYCSRSSKPLSTS